MNKLNRIKFFNKIAQLTPESQDEENIKCNSCEKDIIDPSQKREDEDGNIICKDCYKCSNCDSSFDDEEPLVERHRRRNIPNPIYGCTSCLAECENCGCVREKDVMYDGINTNEKYCEDCHSEIFTFCGECSDLIYSEDAHYTNHEALCESCFNNNYGYCAECNEVTPLQNLHEDENGDTYCEECKPELIGGGKELPAEYSGLEKVDNVSFNKFDRVLNQLKKLLPISVKDLNKNHPRLAASCKDIIKFTGGKDLTPEIVSSFESDMPKEIFPVGYSTWRSQLQRSVRSSKPQLVINVLASENMLQKMKEDKTYDLFDKVNDASKKSGHPYVKDQLGWIRVELHPEEKYVLVDEIQTDHMNAIDRINTESYQGETYAKHIMQKYNMTPEQFKVYLNNYKNHIRDFTDVAMETISNFAKANGFERIFYHTYESGKTLKHNMPPKSLYTTLPERHFFTPTEDVPFGLEGKFFSRTAEELIEICNIFYKLANDR